MLHSARAMAIPASVGAHVARGRDARAPAGTGGAAVPLAGATERRRARTAAAEPSGNHVGHHQRARSGTGAGARRAAGRRRGDPRRRLGRVRRTLRRMDCRRDRPGARSRCAAGGCRHGRHAPAATMGRDPRVVRCGGVAERTRADPGSASSATTGSLPANRTGFSYGRPSSSHRTALR